MNDDQPPASPTDEDMLLAVTVEIDRIARRPSASTVHLQVQAQVFQGTVVLTGSSSSAATRWAVGEVAVRVPGVRAVVNSVRLCCSHAAPVDLEAASSLAALLEQSPA